MLYIASLDNYLMDLSSLVRKGRPHPVLAIRTQLSAHLRENLKTLGLKRVAKTLSLTEIPAKDEPETHTNGHCDSKALTQSWSILSAVETVL